MAQGSSSNRWDLRVPWGGKAVWNYQLWQGDGTEPFVMSGHVFEYVVKTNITDSVPLIRLQSDVPGSPLPAGSGLITLTSGAVLSQVSVALYPPATSVLAPPTTLYHALWMDYADTVNAYNLFWGQFQLDQAIQP